MTVMEPKIAYASGSGRPSGYKCARRNTHVEYGSFHHCFVWQTPVTRAEPEMDAADRVAAALERIAVALETLATRV